MNDIRIAAAVVPSPAGCISENLERAVRLTEKAKAHSAKLICFPELSICGYDISPDIADSAQPVPGQVSKTLCELSGQTDMVILAGLAEKDDTGNVFASHLVFRPDGFVGVYRKLHIAPPEKPVFAAGNEIPVFEAAGIHFAVQLCYDTHFPELSTAMALKGADILFMPHASPRGAPKEKYASWMRHLPARAYDNSVFVVACNQIGDSGKGLRFPGVALAVDPCGKIIQNLLTETETLMIADLKADDLKAVRSHRMRYFLPNRRPELYS